MHKKNRFTLVLILGLLSAIGPFSIDMYLPGFPAIAADLGTTVEVVGYSLSSFFVGICLGQLICGPLLDRYGRKKPLYIGLAIYLLASLGCALAPSVEVLIALRFLQALGGCVGMVAPRAVVRDVFPVQESAKVFSMLVLVIGVSPIIAPTAGSYFITTLGWHSVFVVLAIITAAITTAVFFRLPESKKPDPAVSLRPLPIMQAYGTVLKEPQFFTYAGTGAICSAALFAYISGSPYVFMELFGVSEQHYGWIFALIAVGLIASSQFNNFLLKKFSSEQIIRFILPFQLAIGILLFLGSYFGWTGLYSTIFLIFLFLSCQGLTFPNSSALAMAPFTRDAGSASALMGAIQMGLGAFASALVGLLANNTAIPMTGVMAACALIGLLILSMGTRKIRYQSRYEDVEEQTVDMIEKY
jgi:DHA1 family bicyclomycin/chloramphenicol resistance-like MFS transporter